MGNKQPKQTTPALYRLYYEAAEYHLNVYPSTTIDELLAAIHSVLRIRPDPSANILFLDDRGEPVALSSNLPSGIQLYVTIERPPVAEKRRKISSSESSSAVLQQWSWNPDTNTSPESHFLSRENKEYAQPSNQAFAGIRGDRLLGAGLHFWTLHAEEARCCSYVGVVSTTDKLNRYGGPFMLSFHGLRERSKSLAFTSHTGATNAPLDVAFFLDGDKHVLRAFDLDGGGKRKCIFKVEGLPAEVFPAVSFKHETVVTLTGTGLHLPHWLDLENDDDRLIVAEGN